MEECKNLEYEKALENEDYAKILNSVCKKYRFRMDKEDLHRCKLIALWDAIKKFSSHPFCITALHGSVGGKLLKTIREKQYR